MSYRHLDRQLAVFDRELTAAVGLQGAETASVATSIAAETRFLEPTARAAIFAASPIPLRDRIQELTAFQAFMDSASGVASIVNSTILIISACVLGFRVRSCGPPRNDGGNHR